VTRRWPSTHRTASGGGAERGLVIDLPAVGLHLEVGPGEIAALPDDPAVVAAIVGRAHVPDRRIDPTGRGGAARTARPSVVLDGRRIDRRSPARRVAAGLAAVLDTEVADDVTVGDHLAAVVTRARAAEVLADCPVLPGRAGDPAGVLSGGERRALAWAIAVVVEPRAVVLDQAGTGLDAAALAWAHGHLDRWLDARVAVAVRVGREAEQRWLTHRADGTGRTT
jgi:hypothetical protein